MKNTLILTLFMLAYSLQAQIYLTPNHNVSNIGACPNTSIEYTVEGIPAECNQFTIELVSGLANTFATSANNNKFTVVWADISQVAHIRFSPKVNGCPAQTDFFIPVISVANTSPSIFNCPGQVVIGKNVTFTLTASLFYNAYGVNDPMEVDSYEWQIASGGSGWTLTPGPAGRTATITTDIESDAVVRVRGVSHCGDRSGWTTCTITRYVQPPCPIVGAPSFVVCKDMTPIALSATLPSGVTGYTYEWTFPQGWTGNTQGAGTTVTPSGVTGGKIRLVAKAFGKTSSPCEQNVNLEVIHPNTQITGPVNVCSSTQGQFGLSIPLPPGTDVTWSVSPSNLVTPFAGNGAVANVSAHNTNNGQATISFSVDNDCGTKTISKTFFVGKPTTPVIIGLPDCFPQGDNMNLNAYSQGATSYSWTFPTCGVEYDPVEDPFPTDCWYNYTGDSSASGQVLFYVGINGGSVSVFASNVCGVSSINAPINFCDEPGGGPGTPGAPIIPLVGNGGTYGTIYPNPASGYLDLTLLDTYFDPTKEKTLYIQTQNGNNAGMEVFTGNQKQILLGALQPGQYTLFILAEERVAYAPFVKL
ncbi:MAG: hypothetical protein SFV22_13305 [Saprospiraceae bacterium]|nr:hypothetical protein [Saprospiraceae bacterium]